MGTIEQTLLAVGCLFLAFSPVLTEAPGPRYQFISSSSKLPWTTTPSLPLSAAWFKDRMSVEEWNTTLRQFQSLGGEVGVLRAPPVMLRTKAEVLADPDYRWCGEGVTEDGTPMEDCVSAAERELGTLGLNVSTWATFDYEEDYGDGILACPQVDKKINGSRIYHRLVFKVSTSNRYGKEYYRYK